MAMAEGVCASVVSGCDAAPVLDSAEQVLDLVALAIELLVVVILDLAVGLWRDAGDDTLAAKELQKKGQQHCPQSRLRLFPVRWTPSARIFSSSSLFSPR
jgi:hypothetical protein